MECGLQINPQYPHLAASPDGLVSCDCCGNGVIEIKCPYCFKENFPDEGSSCAHKRLFCMEKVNGKYSLKRQHPYFFHIQVQMLVSKRQYADFVV